MNSSDDENARDQENVRNKIPGAVGTRVAEVQQGMNPRRLKSFEAELKGTYNHKFLYEWLDHILYSSRPATFTTMALYLLAVHLGHLVYFRKKVLLHCKGSFVCVERTVRVL